MGENETIEGVKIPWLYSQIGTQKVVEDTSGTDSNRINYSITYHNTGLSYSNNITTISITNVSFSKNNYQYRIIGKIHLYNSSFYLEYIIKNIYKLSAYLSAYIRPDYDGTHKFLSYVGQFPFFTCQSYGGYTQPQIAS